MADPFQYVQRGQLVPRAKPLWDAIVDAAKAQAGRKAGRVGGGGTPSSLDPALYALALYDTSPSETLEPFSILGYGAVDQDVAEDTLEVQARPAFTGVVPASATAPFVVTIEPIGGGEIGQVVTAGVAHVWLKVNDPAHGFARPVVGQTDYLESATSGVPILYTHPDLVDDEEEHAGIHWARVLLGGGGAGCCDEPAPTPPDLLSGSAAVSSHAVSADYAWEDTGTEITLPAAGTYLLWGRVLGMGWVNKDADPTAVVEIPTTNPSLHARLVNGSTAVSGTTVTVYVVYLTRDRQYHSASFTATFTVLAATTLKLQVFGVGPPTGYSWDNQHGLSTGAFEDGRVGYVRLTGVDLTPLPDPGDGEAGGTYP